MATPAKTITPTPSAGPQATADLIGHATAERTLLDAHASGRMHHAWLLTGPRGIGKATLAYRFARFLLAHPPQEAGEGGLFGDLPSAPPQTLAISPEHPVFHRVAAGSHGDLLTVTYGQMTDGRPRTEIVVDDVRGLGQFFSKTSAEGGWRVAIVDSADTLNRNAANALLKVLEEPPARAILLLVAHAPGRVLPTILSRCRRLALRPLDPSAVDDFIGARFPELPSGERALLAALAEGSPGYAAALGQGQGLKLYQRLLGVLASLPRLDQKAVQGLADELGGRGGEGTFALFGTLLGDLLNRVVRTGAGPGPASPIPGEGQVLQRLAAIASLDRWIEVWEKSSSLMQRADAINLDRRQVVIMILSDLAAVTRS